MASILLIADTFPPNEGGSEAYLGTIARGLASNNHRVDVFAPATSSRLKAGPTCANLSVRRSVLWERLQRLGGSANPLVNRSARLLLLPYLLLRLIVRRYDIIIVGHVLPAGLIAKMLRRMRRCEAVVVVTYGEEISMYVRGKRMSKLLKQVIDHADAVTCLTSDSCKELDKLVPGVKTRCFVIPPAVPPLVESKVALSPFTPAPGETCNLFTISRLVERKGIDTVIRAVAMLLDEFPLIQYTVAGAGPDRPRLQALIETLNLQSQVRLVGRVEDPHELFRQCDIFCMVNRELESGEREGFGIVFLEAGLHRKPSIAGRSGGAVDAVLDGKTGMLVNPDDPAETADAIRQLMNDKELRARLGSAARAFAETFTEQRQVASFESIIEKCLRQ